MTRLAAILAALWAQDVAAQTNCAERGKVVARLASNYGESQIGGGVQNAQRIFEVWYSEDKGTWTILMTRADGISCIMASGTSWREYAPNLVPEGVPG